MDPSLLNMKEKGRESLYKTQRGQDVKGTAPPLEFIVKNDVLIPGTFQRELSKKTFINIPQ